MKRKIPKITSMKKMYFTLTAFCNMKLNAQEVLTEISLKIDDILENWL